MKNQVGVIGRLLRIEKGWSEVYGRSVKTIEIETDRKDGKTDRVVIKFEDEAAWEWDGKRVYELEQGALVMAEGRIETERNLKTRKTKVFVLADIVSPVSTGAMIQNDVLISGMVKGAPNTKETKTGNKVTDVIIMTPSVFDKNHMAFVPVVGWKKIAESMAKLKDGDVIECQGRFQSREFIKIVNGKEEKRTAFEVSIYKLRKSQEE